LAPVLRRPALDGAEDAGEVRGGRNKRAMESKHSVATLAHIARFVKPHCGIGTLSKTALWQFEQGEGSAILPFLGNGPEEG